MEYNRYTAPPPVAARDFIYLVEKRYVPEQQSYYIYGTSVDFRDTAGVKIEKDKCVRGAVMFGWRLRMVGTTTHCTYVSCMNPNGWAPTFIVGWMKTEIAKEFQNSRRLLYQDVPRQQTTGAAAFFAAKAQPEEVLRAPINDAHQNALSSGNSSARSSERNLKATMESEERRLLVEEEPILFE